MRTFTRSLGVTLLLCAVAVIVAACSGTVMGKVTNRSSGQPLQGAVVQVGTRSAATAANGTFEIKGVPTGSHQATVICHGYANATSRLQVKRGTNSLDVALQDGGLAIHVTEDTANPEPTQGAVATLDGSTMRLSGTSSFSLSDVLLGEHRLVVTAPNHLVFEANVQVHDGTNSENVALSLTAAETSRRQNAALLFYNWRQAYLFLSPLWRKIYPYSAYVADTRFNAPQSAEKCFGSYHVPRFTVQWDVGGFAKGNGKVFTHTFTNLVAVRCAVTLPAATVQSGVFYQTQMWKKIAGRWYEVSEA